MGVALNHPSLGAVGWSSSVDTNWTTIETQYLARQTADTTVVTVTGTTSETVLMTSTTIAANSLAVGTTLRVFAAGTVNVPALSTPNVVWRLRYGGISGTVLTTFTSNYGSFGSAYDAGWARYTMIACISTGGSGTVAVSGYAAGLGVFGTDTQSSAVTIDTTASAVLVWTAQPSAVGVSVKQRAMSTDR